MILGKQQICYIFMIRTTSKCLPFWPLCWLLNVRQNDKIE